MPTAGGGRVSRRSRLPARLQPGAHRPGQRDLDGVANTPKIVSGIDDASLDGSTAFYDRHRRHDGAGPRPREAELTKLLENTFRHVNIALVNELAMFAHELGIDVWEVIDAAATKPFGFMTVHPRPGRRRPLPADRPVLPVVAGEQQLGQTFRFVELANDVNEHMPDYVVPASPAAQRSSARRSTGVAMLLLGLAYKKNSGDARESPAARRRRAACRRWGPSCGSSIRWSRPARSLSARASSSTPRRTRRRRRGGRAHRSRRLRLRNWSSRMGAGLRHPQPARRAIMSSVLIQFSSTGPSRARSRDVPSLIRFAAERPETLRLEDGVYCFDRDFGRRRSTSWSVAALYASWCCSASRAVEQAGTRCRRGSERTGRPGPWRTCTSCRPGDLGLVLWMLDMRRGKPNLLRCVTTSSRSDDRTRRSGSRSKGWRSRWLAARSGRGADEMSDAACNVWTNARAEVRTAGVPADTARAPPGTRSRARLLPNFATQIYALLALAETSRRDLRLDRPESKPSQLRRTPHRPCVDGLMAAGRGCTTPSAASSPSLRDVLRPPGRHGADGLLRARRSHR